LGGNGWNPFSLTFERTPKKEVLGHIIDGLGIAKENLPTNPDAVKDGKLTTWAARHSLAKCIYCVAIAKVIESRRECAGSY
jgi:hypothetical protein